MQYKTHVRRLFKGETGMRLVEVLWWDAQAKALDWEEKVDGKAVKTASVGYVVHDLDEAITLVAVVNENHVAHAITIPTGCIESIRDLN